MTYGEGSIQPIARNKWRIYKDFGKNPITGKRERITRVINGSKADARKALHKIIQEHENGLSIESMHTTFSDFAATYHDARVASNELSKTYTDRERREIETLNAYIGDMLLSELTPHLIETLYTTIRHDKIVSRGKCSGTTMSQLHATLKRILRKAVDYDLILRNPCDRVQTPKRNDPERRALDIADGSRLLRCIDNTESAAYTDMEEKEARQTQRGNLFGREYLRGLNTISNVLAVRIGLATGMRRGEVFGILWGYVDLNKPCIHVRKSLTTFGELKEPKTKAGLRTIYIDSVTAEHINVWKKKQQVELLKIGIKQSDNTPVCCSEKGDFIDLHNFERWWRNFRKENGFEGLRFHELRHTQATQLLANGVDVKTVQTRLGHSNASLTLNWYAHAVEENDKKAAKLVGDLFAESDKETPILKAANA